ncbi:MAG: glycogen/starch/alpha-glucan phosphorylase, partial [Fusobacteriaceae bacterium]
EGLKEVVDSLVNGTFSDNGTGMFKEIYDSLMHGTSWHTADQYFVLKDFAEYRKIQKLANETYGDKIKWAKMAWLNISNGGKFSSDRTISDYAKEIWHIQSKKI